MKNLYTETIVAPATTPGTGAISIVRLSGSNAFEIADAVVKLNRGTISSSKAYTIHFGKVYAASELLDEVLVSVFRAPHSYTGEDAVEISTHASSYIVQELIRLLMEAGARLAEPGEFTQRAYMNGKMDLAQAEAVADVISSSTLASHRVAMNQLKGGFSSELASLRKELLEMASLLELELDFSEEDVEFADRDKLLGLLDTTLSQVEKLAASFQQGNAIKNGIPVAIVGAANSGKSTLLNALLGEDRAIVSDIAGTTRDTIEETMNIGGILFRFVDTAGIRETSEQIERLGIARTFEVIDKAQIVVGVLDGVLSEEQFLADAKLIIEAASKGQNELILLVNKADLGINKNVILLNNLVSSANLQCFISSISAKTGEGLSSLKNQLFDLEKDLVSAQNSCFVTNIRHYEALVSAANYLRQTRVALASSIPSDLVAEDLRLALRSLGTITGDITDSEVLSHIFSHFCIGK